MFTLPSVHGSRNGRELGTDELGGRAERSNRLVKSSSCCATVQETNSTWKRKSAALPVDWLVESGSASCAARFGSIPRGRGRGHSALRSAHSCSARTPLLPSLTICGVCAACDRRRLLLLLWSQDRRATTARRCGSLLYAGLHRAERLGPSGASAGRRAASIPLGSWCTAVADGATSCSIGLSGQ